MINESGIGDESRLLSIYGDINEEMSSEIVQSLFLLAKTNSDPIQLIISTHGGVAEELFAIYDTMRIIREEVPIYTLGLGKVMSSGLLILSGGTKGHRRAGKNARFMFHDINSTYGGTLVELKNSFEETKILQQKYLSALADETGKEIGVFRKMISKKKDVFFSPQKALDLEIIDKIL